MNKFLTTTVLALLASVATCHCYPGPEIDCSSVDFQIVSKEELFKPTSPCYVSPVKLLTKQLEPSLKMDLDVEKCSCQLTHIHNAWPAKWNLNQETLFNATSYMLLGEPRSEVEPSELYQKLNSSVSLNKDNPGETVRQLLKFREQLRGKFSEIYKPQDEEQPSRSLASYKLDETCQGLKLDHKNLIYFLTGVELERPQYFIKLFNSDRNLLKLIINMNACAAILLSM